MRERDPGLFDPGDLLADDFDPDLDEPPDLEPEVDFFEPLFEEPFFDEPEPERALFEEDERAPALEFFREDEPADDDPPEPEPPELEPPDDPLPPAFAANADWTTVAAPSTAPIAAAVARLPAASAAFDNKPLLLPFREVLFDDLLFFDDDLDVAI